MLSIVIAVLIQFIPPTEYVDGGTLYDDAISHYVFDIYDVNGNHDEVIVINIGNTDRFEIDLPLNRYVICGKTIDTSNLQSEESCTIINLNNPNPPTLCN